MKTSHLPVLLLLAMDGAPTEFDVTLDGVRYSGRHTGILAVRDGRVVIATSGGELHVAE